jgi:heme oxygenase
MLSSWTLRELLRRTKAHHADADLVQLQLLGRVDTLESYRKHLTKLYGFQRPLQSCFAADREITSIGLATTTRLVPLRNDLQALGVVNHDLVRLDSSFGVAAASSAQLLGWLFVSERIGLLSTLILRKLKRRLPEDVYDSATAYMTMCSLQAVRRWVQLGVLLDRHDSALDRVEQGAHDAFAAQRGWFGSFRQVASAKAS